MARRRRKRDVGLSRPSEAPSQGVMEQFMSFARSRLGILTLAIAVPTAAYGVHSMSKQEAQQFESIEIEGVRFNFSEAWKPILSRMRINKGQLEGVLKSHMEKLKDYIDMPKGFSVDVIPGDGGGDVTLQLEYDKNKMRADRTLEITSITAAHELHLEPRLLRSSSALHEMIHLARAEAGTFVAHHGFEEGLAEYGEMKAYPRSGNRPDLFLFLDHFPELENIPLENPVFGFREFSGQKESRLQGIIPLKHELRRRAWARFLDDPGHVERQGFVKQLQTAQNNTPKPVWTIADVLEVGNQIDPAFEDWFEGEPVFKTATEMRVARVLVEKNILHFLTFDFKKMSKVNPVDPDLFEIKPFRESMEVNVKLRGGKELEFTIQARPDGILQKMDLVPTLRQLGSTMSDITGIEVQFVSGEPIPIKILQAHK